MKTFQEISNPPRVTCSCSSSMSAFTLIEVVMATSITAMAVIGILSGYVMSARRAEWSAYSLAAQSLAIQGVEQARACKWDSESLPLVDELVAGNFPPLTNVLDIPINGTNVTWAPHFTTITTVSTNPPLKCVQVNTVWKFLNNRLFTNSAWTYRGTDN